MKVGVYLLSYRIRKKSQNLVVSIENDIYEYDILFYLFILHIFKIFSHKNFSVMVSWLFFNDPRYTILR